MRTRHRGRYWTAVVLALCAVVGGGVLAYLGYRDTASASSAVRGYFEALERGEAATALGFGDVPDGSDVLLTARVLHAQQSIAPIRSVRVRSVHTSGQHGSVAISYTIAFPGNPQQVEDSIPVVRRSGLWRLARSAVGVALSMRTAADRAGVLGHRVPDGDVLMFPGAVPITFDSPYLQLDPAEDYVSFGSSALSVWVDVSASGKTAVQHAVAAGVQACLAAGTHADPGCPLPSERFLPGSLHAELTGPVQGLQVELADGPSGLLDISGTAPARGSYRRLTYANVPVTGQGRVTLQIHAVAYALRPIAIQWVAE